MDRFDIAQALYWFCSDHHEGQGSVKYATLSQLDYKPGMMENGPNAFEPLEIYNMLRAGQLDPEELFAQLQEGGA